MKVIAAFLVCGWIVGCDAGIEDGALTGRIDDVPTRPGVVLDRVDVVLPIGLAGSAGRAPMVVPVVLPDTGPYDNATCQDAHALGDKGARDVPVAGGTRGTGCASTIGMNRYFRVNVGPRELVNVSIVNARPSLDRVWLSSAPACDTPAEACWERWTWSSAGITIANPSDQPMQQIVMALAMEDTVTERYDLEVERMPLADNHTCEAALPLTTGRHEVDSFADAGITSPNESLRRVLYYEVEAPPMTRVSARVETVQGALYAYVFEGCELDMQVPRADAVNTSDTMKTLTIVVGTLWDVADEPFVLTVETAELAPEAVCSMPVTIDAEQGVTVDTEQGGTGPSSCWCIFPTRAVHAAVEVPAGEAIEVVATVVGGDGSDEHGRVDLVELGEQCATECGSGVAFGWGGQAVLRLDNDSALPVVRYVLVSGQAGWNDDPRAPEVELTTRAAPVW